MMDMTSSFSVDRPLLSPLNPNLLTAPAVQFEQQLTQWLWTGASGAVVTGAARSGKTTALDAIAQRVCDRRERSVPVFRMNVARRDRPTIVSVYRQLCWPAGLKITSRQTADELAMSYLHCMADAADKFGVGQIILLVDECQRLTPDQFDVFAELYDRLRMIDRWLLTVFIGNDFETQRLTERMTSGAHAHIRGRFFRQRWTFHGLRSVKEVRDCLAQYDGLPHPFETDRSLVQGLLPESINTGFRLSSVAELFWRAFRDIQKRYKLDSWGMESFAITTNTLLADFLPRYGVDELNEEMIAEAIRISGLLPDIVSTQS